MNKGFTLIEILVSTFIIGLILIIAIPSYIYVYNSTREANYKNKVNYINERVITYGETIKDDIQKTHCKDISIKELIKKGYISSDYKNKEALKNPITNQEFDDTVRLCYCPSDNNLKVFNYNTFDYTKEYTKGERVKYGDDTYECMSSYNYSEVLEYIYDKRDNQGNIIPVTYSNPNCRGYYNSEINLCITKGTSINDNYIINKFFKKIEC